MKVAFVLIPDLNECEVGLDNCDPSADCINTQGSFECRCPEGFTGNGRECVVLQPPRVNECETGEHDCSPLASCIDLVNGFECRCLPGYSGNGRICRGTTYIANNTLYTGMHPGSIKCQVNLSRKLMLSCSHSFQQM